VLINAELSDFLRDSALSGFAASLASGPLDIIKTKWQLAENFNSGLTLKQKIVRFSLFLTKLNLPLSTWASGSIARAVWMVPSIAISMASYEYLKKSLVE
jgi:hypothetical protein